MPDTNISPSQLNAVLIDLDGVLYVGGKSIPGARETLDWLVENQIPHLFLTNTTSRPLREIRYKLKSLGFDLEDSGILTPVVATNQWCLRHQISRALMLVPKATMEDFEIEPVDLRNPEPAQAVIVGDLGYDWSYELLNQAYRTLLANSDCEFLALGMTRHWKDEEGPRLDVAPFVKALEYATDRQARVLGKPSELLFQQGCETLGAKPENTLMIGDDIRTDVQGAQLAGLKGALVKTGKYREQDLKQEIVPNLILESFAGLPEWWES
ncbi:MAG: TIGR01458 family HAD-type hydrolase [Pseudomonadales bacterium]